MTTTKRRAAAAGAISMAGAVISAVAGFAFSIVLSRGYGDVGAGQVMQGVAVAMIAIGLAKCGLDSTMLWRLPRLEDEPEKVRGTITLALLVAFVVGTLAALILTAAAPLIAPGYVEVLRMIIWCVPFGAAMFVGLAALRGLGDIRLFVGIGSIMVPVLRPIAVIAAGAAGAAASMAGLLWALPLPVALVIILVLLRRQLRTAPAAPRLPDRTDRKLLRSYAAPRLLSQALEQLLQWLDVLIVGAVMGAGAAGVYSGAARFVMAGLIVDTAIRVVISPWFSAQLGKGERAAAESLYRRATMWLLLFSIPIYLTLGVFAPVPLSWLGPEFISGASALIILSVGSVITLGFGPVHSVLLMSGHSGWAAVNKAVAVIVNVVLNLLLLPRFGLAGAATAWSVSMLVDALMAATQVRHLLGITGSARQFLLAIALPGLSVGAPATLFCWLWGTASLAAMLATVTVGGLLLLGAMALARGPLGLADLRRVSRRPS